MSDLALFLPITKVDADRRLVYGLATAEVADRAGEICDYASTKPYYEAWSAAMNAASGGKSLGALRAMHGRVAAGKITDIAFDDEGKRILVAAKIVDDEEWRKVEEGVYTGFSQGGALRQALGRSGRRASRATPPSRARSRWSICPASPRDLRGDQGRRRQAARFRGAGAGAASRRARRARGRRRGGQYDGRRRACRPRRDGARTQRAARRASRARDPAGDPDDADDAQADATKIAAPPSPPAAPAPESPPRARQGARRDGGAAKPARRTGARPRRARRPPLEKLEAQPLPRAPRCARSPNPPTAPAPKPPPRSRTRSAASPRSAAERAHALTRISLANPVPPRF